MGRVPDSPVGAWVTAFDARQQAVVRVRAVDTVMLEQFVPAEGLRTHAVVRPAISSRLQPTCLARAINASRSKVRWSYTR